MKVRVCNLKSSPAKWCEVPPPAEPKLYLPGALRTICRNALKSPCMSLGLITKTWGTWATRAIGTKSRSRS